MRRILCGVVATFMGLIMVSTPVFAVCSEEQLDKGCVNTSILGGESGCSCDESGDGSEVKRLLALIVDIMTIGVGILGVLGITVVGIQYLTAGGSEEKTRKAKRRLLEIVIGLVAYVLIYALLKWLIPDFQGL